tara:strand:- start:37 stop:210 length:174 start_codon:yes stop_codon:yes gene_type:complete
MDRKTYNIISFVIIGIVLFVGRYLGLNLLERIICVIIISVLLRLYTGELKRIRLFRL